LVLDRYYHTCYDEAMSEKRIAPLAVRITPALRDEIRTAAAKAGVPVNRWVVTVIRAAIEKARER
jgi:predicted HicB family RNase H-like nuclease